MGRRPHGFRTHDRRHHRLAVRVALAFVVAAFAALGLSAPARAFGVPRLRADTSTPVRYLTTEHGRCSAVILGPRNGLTAAHCLSPVLVVDYHTLIGTNRGHDLAELTPAEPDQSFAPPFARVGRQLTHYLTVEGWGCDSRRSTRRPARTPILTPFGDGLEISFQGRVCRGDSGGALWSSRGYLVGILTNNAPNGDALGWATFTGAARPLPAELPLPQVAR